MSATLAVMGCQPEPAPRSPVTNAEPPPASAPPVVTALPPSPPVSPAVVMVCLSLRIIEHVDFALGSAIPSPTAQAVLEAARDVLREHPDTRVAIEGHRDGQERGLELAKRRAQAVQGYLVDQGIDVSRLCVVSFDDTRPLAEGEREQDRAMNRRVELRRLATDEKCP